MKTWLSLAAAVCVMALAAAAEDDVGKKKTDLVTLKQFTVAKESPFVSVNMEKVYFQDAKSRETFLKNPENYLKTPLECPVRGIRSRANKANRVVVNDGLFYFCCSNCPNGFKKEPQNSVDKLVDPVSGKEFALTADAPKVEVQGALYFFESEENKAAFEKEPAKYIKVKVP
jgi:YHS domain-containing protein